MDNQPKVSIILPICNVAPYLAQCLDSLLCQTMPEVEMICVDCGSTDGSADLVKRYASQDSRFVLICQDNCTIGTAVNSAIKAAKGTYLAFLNGDDFCSPELVEKSYRAAELNQADIVLYDGKEFNDKTQGFAGKSQFLKTALLPKQAVFSPQDVPDDLFQIISPAPWLKLYRASFLLQAGLCFPACDYDGDLSFGICALAQAQRICVVREPLVYHRVNSVRSIQRSRNARSAAPAFYDIYCSLNEQGIYPQVRRSFARAVLSRLVQDLKSAPADEDRYAILSYLQSDRFTQMELLGHEPEWYGNAPAHRSACLLSAAAEQYRLTQAAQRNTPAQQLYSYRGEASVAVSVIIPVYNTAAYLDQALRSIAEQTLNNIEIICVDDGSTDASSDILNRWAEKEPRLSVFHQENAGPSRARNVALKYAKGTYLYFIDSDDILDQTALECLYHKAEDERLDVLYFDGTPFFETEQLRQAHPGLASSYRRRFSYEGTYQGQFLLEKLRENGEFYSSPCLQLIRSAYLSEQKIRFLEGIIHEDNAFSFHVALTAKRAAHLRQALYFRRVRPGSIMTTQVHFSNSYGYFACYLETLRLFLSLQDDLSPQGYNAGVQMLRLYLRLARNRYKQMPDQQQGCEYGLGKDCHLFLSLISEPCQQELQKQSLNSKLKSSNAKLKQANQKLSAARQEVKRQKNASKKLKQSASYRIGCVITWPVRKLKALIKKLRRPGA